MKITFIRILTASLLLGTWSASAAPKTQLDFSDLIDPHPSATAKDNAKAQLLDDTQIIADSEMGVALLKRLKADYPQSAQARREMPALAVGQPFPAFAEIDLHGQPLSLADYKGKVVLIHFWATWCGPCVAELPTVQKAYEKYHARGFEIIGISLDKSRGKLESYLAKKQMPWPQYFDAGRNKLAIRYGVTGIPTTFLLDREGNIIAKDLRGNIARIIKGGVLLERAVAQALAK